MLHPTKNYCFLLLLTIQRGFRYLRILSEISYSYMTYIYMYFVFRK